MAKTSKKEKEKNVQVNPTTGTEGSPVSIPEMGNEENVEFNVTKKLLALYTVQSIDTQIDKILNIRGELPLEVEDLEDEIQGLQTRVDKLVEELKETEAEIAGKKISITDAQELIKKYEGQQMNVRNNREYDSLSKEIEYQTLEVELSEKKIKEFSLAIEVKKETLVEAKERLDERQKDLDAKKGELDSIIEETKIEEDNLRKQSESQKKFIDERLLSAYHRIRANMRNGLAVVPFERNACGGCFNKIPPQRQLDIKLHKKIIVCEYCGRVLVDDSIVSAVESKQ
jgi:predicted  nucleic acid-binding Zn-ribbon protein